MIAALSIILFILLIIIGGKRGLKTFITLYVNLFLVLTIIVIVGWGFNPIIPTIVICMLISLIILFLLNGFNKKTIASFISVSIILILFAFITFIVGNNAYIQGYSEETVESISYVTYNVGLDLISLSNCVIIIGLIGNIIDTSIAISSALFEVKENNPKLKQSELFTSGMNIGKDILGTTTNTLFFAFLGSYMTLLIFYQDHKYDILTILNNKVFVSEIIRIMLSGIASFLIIPISSYITSLICTKGIKNNEKIKNSIWKQKPNSSR